MSSGQCVDELLWAIGEDGEDVIEIATIEEDRGGELAEDLFFEDIHEYVCIHYCCWCSHCCADFL